MKKHLKFRRISLFVVLCLLNSSWVLAQNKTITGVVTDNVGETLTGVTIVVKGTKNAAFTDVNGKYSIGVNQSADMLVFSYMGMVKQEVRIDGKSVIDVIMQKNEVDFDEVVVVGYGTQRRESVTGSLTSISADKIMDLPTANLSSTLAGRLSGVVISQGTGKPGTSSSFSIRAKGTINNSDPLYVINGVVRDKFAFDGLDASEVENITVLKDGASAAIYGSRAANGVVLVTTRKGFIGKPVITYTGTMGLETPAMIPETMSAFEHATYLNDAAWTSYITNPSPTKVDPRTQSSWYTDDELEHFKTTNYSWLNDAWETPFSTRHTLNVTGGSEAVRYFIGGSYYYDKGSFSNLSYNKYNLRASVEANITKNLTASLNLSTDNRNDVKPNWKSDGERDRMNDLYKGMLLRTKFIPSMINGLPVWNGIEWHPLMLISKESGLNTKKWQNVNADFVLEYKVPQVKGLKLKLLYNKSIDNTLIKQVKYPYTLYQFKTAGTNNHYIDPSNELTGQTKVRDDGNYVKKSYELENNYQLNAFVTYDWKHAKHDLNALFVYEQAEGNNEQFDALRNFLVSPTIPEFFAAGSDPTQSVVGDGDVGESGRQSYVSRLNYTYDSKYLLEAAFRFDGSTKFAPENRWGFFPSLSAGWRISSEPFFENNVPDVNYLKFRGSYAMLGNDAVGGWQWMPRYGITTGAIFENQQLGIVPQELPNYMLTWEKSRSYNLGFDSRFLNDRFNLSFEYFYRQTFDILDTRTVSVPTTFGAKLPKENYSAIDSRGIEVELGYNSDPKKDLQYYANGNFGVARSWWVKRDEATNMRPYLSEIGQNIGRIWGYESTGIIRTQEQLDAILTENPTMKVLGQDPVLGMLMYKDVRGPNSDEPDGIITTDDKVVVVENALPPITYGFNMGMKWKGLMLDVFFQGLAGYQKVLDFRSGGINNHTSTFKYKVDHWTEANPNASQPSAKGDKNNEVSTFWVRDASFLRCKNVTLSYDIPTLFTKKLGINRVKLFVNGTNLFLLEDHIKWMDPEAVSLSDYPVMRNFSFGLNVII
ncbi:MAG TPA: TonB-dependent receptor [Bacteroidales bacterium]|nr:TonB-dependent receptor [Bacteroidales bacterium]